MLLKQTYCITTLHKITFKSLTKEECCFSALSLQWQSFFPTAPSYWPSTLSETPTLFYIKPLTFQIHHIRLLQLYKKKYSLKNHQESVDKISKDFNILHKIVWVPRCDFLNFMNIFERLLNIQTSHT